MLGHVPEFSFECHRSASCASPTQPIGEQPPHRFRPADLFRLGINPPGSNLNRSYATATFNETVLRLGFIPKDVMAAAYENA